MLFAAPRMTRVVRCAMGLKNGTAPVGLKESYEQAEKEEVQGAQAKGGVGAGGYGGG